MPDPSREVQLTDAYTQSSGRVFMSGIQALVRLTLDQRRLDEQHGLETGLFVSGYEGSPLGGLDLAFQRAGELLEDAGVAFRPGLNEELAATAVSGTQSISVLPGHTVDGVVGLWYGKSPGLDRAADAIRHGNLSGTSPVGGAVAWIGDDPASKSSTVPSSSMPICRSLNLPVLVPGTVDEILSFGLHAVRLSRYSGTWTAMLIATDIADASSSVNVDQVLGPFRQYRLPEREDESRWLTLPPTNLDAEEHLITTRIPRALEYAVGANLNSVEVAPPRPRMALVGVGLGYQAIVRALDDMGITSADCEDLGWRLGRIGMPWPVDRAEIRTLCGDVETVLVVEDKSSFFETLTRDALYGLTNAPTVLGKTDHAGNTLLPVRGFVTADDVTKALGTLVGHDSLPESARGRLKQLRPRLAQITVSTEEEPSRAPYFCSGCPHNTSTRAHPDQLVGLGIGCHTLAGLDTGNRRGKITGITQMGGEGAQWLGQAPFTTDQHFIQNLGDGTFHHSGSLAIRAAVAAGVNMTYRLLYNDAVAMTGGQHPEGQRDIADLTRLLEAEGVSRIVVTTPEPRAYRGVPLAQIASVRSRDDYQQVQQELEQVEGVTVLIHEDRCANEKRRLRKRGMLEVPQLRVVINPRVCEGCGDCAAKSTCLSLLPTETSFGRKMQVHQSSCNFDMTCLKGDCPSFMLVRPGSISPQPEFPELPNDLPEPEPRVPDDVLLRLPGIGGTGVVTVSAILQMAAHVDGKYAAGLDQIGLAQKGGSVISDIRIGSAPIGGQLRASLRSVDVVLGFDLVGAASADNLSVTDPSRTVAVLNTSITPTAAMVTDPSAQWLPAASAIRRITRNTRAAEVITIDVDNVAEGLFGNHLLGNIVLLGAAYQHGCIPISDSAIEAAIRLNGTLADANIRAFRWGRVAVADPERLAGALAGLNAVPETTTHPASLGEVERRRLDTRLSPRIVELHSELTDYQNTHYANRYLDHVEGIWSAERASVSTSNAVVTEAFAEGLFKLMAYKDEYEVARLHLLDYERDRIKREFGEDAKVRLQLHPPLLRALGLRKKMSFGPFGFPALRVLAAVRAVRGTKLDPFGYTRVRRIERALVGEYVELVHQAMSYLDSSTVGQVVAIAELADMIRGYESIKLDSIERFRRAGREQLERLRRTVAEPQSASNG